MTMQYMTVNQIMAYQPCENNWPRSRVEVP
jgi:hypothetical protein